MTFALAAGYITGNWTYDDGIEELLASSCAESLEVVDVLGRIAALGSAADRVFALENLNTLVDHPRVPFAKAADIISR